MARSNLNRHVDPFGIMALRKKLLRSDTLRRCFCWLVSLYLRFVYATSSWDHREDEYLLPLLNKNGPFIISLWHNRVVMMPLAWRHPKKIGIFTSDHRDGRLVAYTMGFFGFSAVFGSTQRTELKTIRRIVKSLRGGGLLGLTPDGPRGPRMRLKPGVVSIAKMAQVPIIPVCYSTNRRIVLNTWDKLVVPLPFTKGVFLWGEPIAVPDRPSEDDLETVRATLEQRMCDLAAEADKICGHEPMQPAAWDDYRRGVRDRE